MKLTEHITNTPQTEQAHPGQRANNAGGYAFTIDKWSRLERFIILGSEGGTYYVSERKLTRDNAGVVIECLKEDAPKAISLIRGVSMRGLAPKNDAAIFALAMAASAGGPHVELGEQNQNARLCAHACITDVCRTGTHLFAFVDAVKALRGHISGRSLKGAIAAWYAKPAGAITYQMLKYQQRNGWSHRDVLRLCHAQPVTRDHQALFKWSVKGEPQAPTADMPPLLCAFLAAKDTGEPPMAQLIREHGLTREMVPTEALNRADVWHALLEKMPIGAMIRNLGKMSAVGLLAHGSDTNMVVAERLVDVERLKGGRIHPIGVLNALRVYAQGHGDRGKLSWTPVPTLIDALNDAFYRAFETIEPTNKRIMLALDVSGSMSVGIAGMSLSAREASCAMAMATLQSEPRDVHTYAFASAGAGRYASLNHRGITALPLSKRQRLDDVVGMTSRLPFGGTDCALPMIHAAREGIEADAFVVYTDSETWHGAIHPHTALEQYRQKMGIDAKLIVCGTTATEFSIANPNDPGMLDVVGFSADCPAVLANFIGRG